MAAKSNRTEKNPGATLKGQNQKRKLSPKDVPDANRARMKSPNNKKMGPSTGKGTR